MKPIETLLLVNVSIAFLIGPVASAAGHPPAERAECSIESVQRLPGDATRIRVTDVVLDDLVVSLDLERFEVFTKDAWIDIHSDSGRTRGQRPTTRYYRGVVSSDSGGLAFLEVGDRVTGLVSQGGRITVISGTDSCQVADIDHAAAGAYCVPSETRSQSAPAVPPGFQSSGVVYDISVAIETDHELFAKFGSSAALLDYVGRLFGVASAIYNRDVATNLRVAYVGIWTSADDPWSVEGSTLAASVEFSNYWHRNRANVNRSLAHFLSGRNLAGIAQGYLCSADVDLQNGNWTGAYSFSGSILGVVSTIDSLYVWDALVVCHEIGHQCGANHTHCYSPPVDMCANWEAGCYSGPMSIPPEGGTIMSYCHTLGWSNVRLILGRTGERSQVVIDGMRSMIESKAACLTLASSCTYSVSPVNVSFPAAGGPGTVSITTDASCPWAATSDGAFVTFTSNDLGSGGATVSYSVAANAGSTPRSATLTVAGQPVTITQGGSACVAEGSNLCLTGNRFRVTVAWTNPYDGGSTGVGMPSNLTPDTGSFWFFSPSNIELVVKVLDGRATNGKFWVFYGALSDVAYTITVTDTQTGAVKTYVNEARRLASVADTSAF